MILSLAVMIGLIALYFVLSSVQPLTEGSVMTAEEWQRLEDETLVLLQRRDRVFAEIRELDFEAALNKVDIDDFTVLKRRYEDEALEIMDQLQVAFETYGSRIDDDIEVIVQAARQRRKAASENTEVAEVAIESGIVESARNDEAPSVKAQSQAETAISEVGRSGVANPAGITKQAYQCSTCDASLPRDARFCDHCGAEQLALCASCGFENRLNARFCRSCGDALEPRG